MFAIPFIKRLFYFLAVLSTIHFFTFLLFFAVYSPDDIAKQQLGDKHVTQEMVENWKVQQGYNQPLLLSSNSIFFTQTRHILQGDWGLSFQGLEIQQEIKERMSVSIKLMIPIFFASILGALIMAIFILKREFPFHSKFNSINNWTSFILKNTVLAFIFLILSTTSLTWLLAGQWLGTSLFPLFPVSGYDFESPTRFLILPIILGCVIRIPAQAKLYLNLLQQEQYKDYVRTAVSKKLPLNHIIWQHLLPNVLPSLMTMWGNSIPFLLLGSLLLEKLFALPGLGDYVLEAVQNQDLQVLQIMIILSVILTLFGQFLGDFLSDWVRKADKVYE